MQTLTTAYLFDELGGYTDTVQLDPIGRIPESSTFEPPPILGEGQCTRWNGSSWIVLDEVPVIPESDTDSNAPLEVSRMRGLQALYKMHGLKESDIEAAIVHSVTDPDAQYLALLEFRAAQTFDRHRELVVMMGAVLNLDLPPLFIYAASLP